MARTLYGNLTGAAARTAKREQKEETLHGHGISQTEVYVLLLTSIQGDAFVQWWNTTSPTLSTTEQFTTLQARFEAAKARMGLTALVALLNKGG